MYKLKDLEIGQQLYAVHNDKRNGEPFIATVEKKIRADIVASGIRFIDWDYDGFAVGQAKGGGIHIYLSKEEYENFLAWKKFTLNIDRCNLTKEQRLKILAITQQNQENPQ